jgi:molybdopterin converting factor subunit 1
VFEASAMKVKVLFFGFARDLTGLDQEEVEILEGTNLSALRRIYESRFPRLREFSGSLLASINQQVAEPSARLEEQDEVAFLPPVSGGREDDTFEITQAPVLVSELAAQVKTAQDGAVVVFEGIVRSHSRGRRTLYLEYDAYKPMALRKMQEIAEEVHRKFPVGRIAMVHRTGRLEIGETSVAIVVASVHRKEAFEACHYAIDRLKQSVPIWKKEHFEDGAVWAESEAGSQIIEPSRV